MREPHLFLVVLGALLAISCATFADLPNPHIVRDANVPARPSAYLEVSVDAYTILPSGRGYLVAPWGWPLFVEHSLSEAQLFSAISRERSQQDLHVLVNLTVAHTPMSNALPALLTGFLFPAFDHRSVIVAATIRDHERGIETRAQASHVFRTWLELFLLPLFFTHDPGSYEYDVAMRLSSSAVSQALETWAQRLAAQQDAAAAER
jgi:hypothetical protein